MPQFSLKTLMKTVLGVSLLCAFLFALPDVLAIFVVLATFFLFIPVVVGGIVYFRGYPQAFFIGCAASLAAPWMWMAAVEVFDAGMGVMERVAVLLIYVLIGASGLVVMGMRRLALRHAARRSNSVSAAPVQPSATPSPPGASMANVGAR